MSIVPSLLFPIAERAIGSRFWSLFRESRRHPLLTDHQRSEIQQKNIHRLLQHASETVPVWRDRFPSRLLTPSSHLDCKLLSLLCELPITTKSDLRVGFPEAVTSGGPRKHWRYGNSAGTVDRITIVTDFKKRDYLRATNLRISNELVGNPLGARIVEIPPNACNVVCALRDEGPLELKPFLAWAFRKGILFRREILPDLRGRIERSWIVQQDTLAPLEAKSFADLTPQLDRQLDRITSTRPNILRGLPLYLLWLAKRATQRDLRFPALNAIMPYGGLMSGAMADRVSAAFDTPFYDFYGTSEIGAVALQHPGEEGMRVFDDLLLVEVVDDQNRPLSAGKPGRILITDFHNDAMPLIRYEIGDYGYWLHDDMSTNDPFQLNRHGRLKVLGRNVETMKLPSGTLVAARDIMDTLFQDKAVSNARVECRHKDQFTLKYAGEASIAPKTIENLQSLLGAPESLRVRPVSYLRPESSGKHQVFKAEAFQEYCLD